MTRPLHCGGVSVSLHGLARSALLACARCMRAAWCIEEISVSPIGFYVKAEYSFHTFTCVHLQPLYSIALLPKIHRGTRSCTQSAQRLALNTSQSNLIQRF
jgi:hypothetical protein